MFEILKALMEMEKAARARGGGFTWDFETDRLGETTLVAKVTGLGEEDVEFVDQMKQMFAPVGND